MLYQTSKGDVALEQHYHICHVRLPLERSWSRSYGRQETIQLQDVIFLTK